MSEKSKHREIELVQKLAKVMDSQFEIPGTGIKVGLDPIIGLIPGLGDFVTNVLGAYPIRVAIRHELPTPIIWQMVFNLGVDYILGTIPILGDVFDIFFKANQRNLQLLMRGMDSPATQKRHSLILVVAVSLFLMLILISPLVLVVILIIQLSS